MESNDVTDSCQNNENDGFTVVKSKSKKNKNKSNNNNNSDERAAHSDYTLNDKLDENKCQKLYNTILEYKTKLLYHDQCKYWLNFRHNFNNFIQSLNKNSNKIQLEIKSYGLGSLENNLNSRYQFALALLFVEELKNYEFIILKSCNFYDPIFNLNDKYVIVNLFKFNVSEQNDEAKYRISDDTISIFYMPHCGKPLYNNLLYSNWSIKNLNNLYLIGNSFSLINTMTLDSDLSVYYKYIKKSIQFLNEIYLSSNCDFTDAFSDLSMHRFKPLCNQDLDFQDDKCEFLVLEEPVYENDEEIVFSR